MKEGACDKSEIIILSLMIFFSVLLNKLLGGGQMKVFVEQLSKTELNHSICKKFAGHGYILL